MYKTTQSLIFFALSAVPLLAQQAPSAVNLNLRCDRVESGKQSKRVNSASLGFGNPTSPETTEDTPITDRTVLIELRRVTGRLHLSQYLLTPKQSKGEGSWFPLADLVVTEEAFTANFAVRPSEKQTLHINRITGEAEITGFGDHPLRGVCRVDRVKNKF